MEQVADQHRDGKADQEPGDIAPGHIHCLIAAHNASGKEKAVGIGVIPTALYTAFLQKQAISIVIYS